MSNPSGRLGAYTETGLVDYLKTHGFPHAERRVTNGNKDRGDISGCIGICWQAKGGSAGQTAGAAQTDRIGVWMAETLVEAQNARADYGILVCKKAGVGHANAGRWWAYLRGDDFLSLSGHRASTPVGVVRITLAEAVALLRQAGYGDELPAVSA